MVWRAAASISVKAHEGSGLGRGERFRELSGSRLASQWPRGRSGTCRPRASVRLRACAHGAPRSGACRAAGRSPARESVAPAARNTRAQRACVAAGRSPARPTGACGRRDASAASLSRSGASAPRVKGWGRARVPEPNVVAVGSAGGAPMLLRQRPTHAGARAQAKPGAWWGSTPPWERARGAGGARAREHPRRTKRACAADRAVRRSGVLLRVDSVHPRTNEPRTVLPYHAPGFA